MAATNKKIRLTKSKNVPAKSLEKRLTDEVALFDLVPELYGTGTSNTFRKCVAKGLYDFSVSGGAIGTIDLLSSTDLIPDKAIVTNVYINIITAMTSTSGSGTVALRLNSGADLLAAVDADTLSGIVAGIPIGTVATMVKATADRNLTLVIATSTLTAGKIVVFAEYVISE